MKLQLQELFTEVKYRKNLKTIFSVFAISDYKHICIDSQTIIKEIIHHKLYNEHEKIEIVKYAIKSGL